jgi:hypothetical protein
MSSTGQPTFPFENLKLIINALADYAKETGIDLSTNPLAPKLEQLRSPEDILQLLEEREKAFKEYREGSRRLTNFLNPAVKVLHGFSGILSETAGLVSRKCHLVGILTLTSSDPVPTSNPFVFWDRYSPQCTSLEYYMSFKSSPVMYEHARPPVKFHQVMTPSWISSSIWGVSLSAWTSIQRSNSLR